MKHLSIEKNRHLLRLEFSDQPCVDLMLNKIREIRFDIVLDEGTQTENLFRAKVFLDEENVPFLEIKDYRDNSRTIHPVRPLDGITEVSNQALNAAWNLLEGSKDALVIVPEEQP